MDIKDPYYKRLAQVESNMNPLAKNPRSNAAGIFQFMPETAEQYGLKNPFDPNESLQAVQRFTEDNKNVLRQALGREPNPSELYLAHQQGAIGAAKLLANPNAKAIDVVGSNQILLNAGNPEMTAQDFSNQWTSKFNAGFENNNEEFIDVETPDGVVEFPKSMTDEDILSVLREKYPPIFEKPKQLSPAEIMQSENPLLRTVGRLGRNVTGGAAALTDIPLLIPKTLANVAEMGLEKAGYSGTALEKFAERVGRLPSMRESVLAQIDASTGNKLKPIGGLESTVDFINEAMVPTGSFTKGANAIKNTIGGFLNPTSMIRESVVPATRSLMSIPKADDIKLAAGNAYKIAKQKGAQFTTEFMDDFADKVINKVSPQTDIGKSLSGDNPVTKIIEKINGLRGRPLDLDAAQEIDEFLTDTIDDFSELGRVTKQGKKLLDVQNIFRDMIDNSSNVIGDTGGISALKEGRKLWSKAAKARDVEKIVTRAELSDQPANAIRNGFKNLLTNPQRLKGYNKQEQDLIRRAAEGSLPIELLRTTASRLFGIGSALGGVNSFILGKATEMGSRGLQTKLAMDKANELSALIALGGKAPTKTSALSKISPAKRAGITGLASYGLNRTQEENK